jgi:hypothetical protein
VSPDGFDRDQVREYVRTHPAKSPIEVLGSLGLNPSRLDEVSTYLKGRKEDSTPGVAAAKSGSSDGNPWIAADFANPESNVWPESWQARKFWMARIGKRPFAPWSDSNHSSVADEKDARWSWSIAGNWAGKATVDEWVAKDPRLDGHVVILEKEADPYTDDPDPFAFVDGDDVRCPETGDVHPGFVAIVERLGVTYADVSTSGTGVHAMYEGRLPDDVKQAVFELDTEPWGANDSPPAVEIYDGKRVCVATGAHVPGTPTDVRPWDGKALEAILDEHLSPADRRPASASHDTDRERLPANYEPKATDGDETASDLRDVLHAVDRLTAGDLPLRTRQVGTDGTGWEMWDPSTYRTSSGKDSLHTPDGRVFHDFKHGRSFGLLSLFAAEQGIIDCPWEQLAGADWWEAVERAREAGAPIPRFDGGNDSEQVAVLPTGDSLTLPASGWDWRHAGRRINSEDPLITARERTVEVLKSAMTRRDRVLVEALPTLGKSYGTIKAAAETGEPVTVLTTRGHKEQYAQIRDWCAEFGLTPYTLPSFTRDCETANGEHGEDWKQTVLDWYKRGATPKDIHMFAEYELGRPLPCQEHGHCPYVSKWDFDPNDFDVLIGHYAHAHKQKVTCGRTVVLDEFPEETYETCLSHRLEGAVTSFLQSHEELPFEDYTDLVEGRHDADRRARGIAWFEDRDVERDGTLVFDDSAGHAAAPLAVLTILAGCNNNLGNGWERARLDRGSGQIGLFDREQGRVYLLAPPPLQYTRAVLALDGTPTREMWELVLGGRLNHRQVLTDDERREYIRDGLNLNLIRTTKAVKPYNSSDHVKVEQDAALLEKVHDQHGQLPALISSRTALKEYDRSGVLERVDGTAYYGNVLGSNAFKDKRLGVVVGSNHFGDGYIEKWAAYAGEVAERGDGKGSDLSYGSFGDKVLTHMREHETFQAAMRFGRDGNGAVVYVHTNTLPDWVPLAGEGRVLSVWSDGMKQVVTAAAELGTWRTRDLVEHPDVEVGERQIRKHLHALAERGYLTVEVEGRGFVWEDDGLHRLGEHGDVELDVVSLNDLAETVVAELARSSIYTWEFRNEAGPGAHDGLLYTTGASAGELTVQGESTDPPEDHD